MTADYDSPWKEALELYLESFLAFAFPEIHALVDWSKPYQSLDAELQQIARDAQLGRRLADKLFRVQLREGQTARVLIHIEVQGQPESIFPERMFVYNYRCFDRYRQPVLSLAILGDESPTWRPSSFGYGYGDCQMRLQFPIFKLKDQENRWRELEASSNPFAVMVMAHLKTRSTRDDPRARAEWKWRLIRGLFERGYDRRDILELFRLVDWMMTLPEELQQGFERRVTEYQEDRQMPLLSRMELRALQRGKQEGLQEGRQEGILENARESVLEVLEARFGEVPSSVSDRLNEISEVARLKQLLKQSVSASSLTAFERELNP